MFLFWYFYCNFVWAIISPTENNVLFWYIYTYAANEGRVQTYTYMHTYKLKFTFTLKCIVDIIKKNAVSFVTSDSQK